MNSANSGEARESGNLADSLTAALGERYEIGGSIGAGGMATVFRARDLKHGREVAIKVLRREIAVGLGSDRFLREIRIAANLHHPHILQLFDSGEAEGGLLYYIMPLVRGETLREKLVKGGPLPLDQALRLTGQIADALDYAHQQGVLHRDIKPENILLESGHALVADFGVGRALSGARLDTTGTLTEAGLAIGTPAYMSPEQIDGATLDGRSDLYSLACVCYEMLSGSPPYTGATVSAILRKHILDAPPSITKKRPEISDATSLTLQKALAKSPDDRFATASEFAMALHTGLTPTATQAMPSPRKRSLAGIGIAAGLLVLLLVGYLAWKKLCCAAPASGSAVAVLPFSVQGNDTLQLGEGMVTLLSTKLDGVGDLRTVDARALLGYIERSGDQSIDLDRAREIAARFSAGLFVLGDVVILGDKVQLSAGLYPVNGDKAVQHTSVEGATDKVFQLVDQLAARLLAEQSSGSGTGLDQVASVTTSSLPAFKAYLDGEREMRKGNFDLAVSAYQRAIAADSSFALAWYRLSVAAEWLTQEDVVGRASARAQALSTHLPDRIRTLLDAALSARQGQFERAEQLYRTITGAAPEDVESWIQLGELLFHNAAMVGRDFRESREPWRRVLALEPDNVIPLIHLARIAAADRDTATLDDMVARVARIRASSGQDSSAARSEELELSMMRAAMINDSAAIDRLLGDLSRSSELTLTITLWDVATVAGNPQVGLRIADLMAMPVRTSYARSLACRAHAVLQMGLGKFKAADRELDRCVAQDPSLGVYWRVFYSTLPIHQRVSVAVQPGSFDSIMEPAVPPPADLSSWVTGPTGTYGHVRVWLRGITAALTGDAETAERRATELTAMIGTPEMNAASQFLADGIRAELAYQAQRWDDALRLLTKPRRAIIYLLAGSSPFYGGTRERFRLAELLERSGQHEEALKWYSSFDNMSFFESPFMALSYKARGEILERLGRTDEAKDAYRRFVRMWADADPDYQPMVAEARARLAALGG